MGYDMNRVAMMLQAIGEAAFSVIMKQRPNSPIENRDIDTLLGVHYAIDNIAEMLEKSFLEYA